MAAITLSLENLIVQIVLNVFSLINDNRNRLGVLKECLVVLFFRGWFIVIKIFEMQI